MNYLNADQVILVLTEIYFGQTDFGPRDYILQYKRCQNIHLVPKLFDRYRWHCRSGGAF